MPLSLRTLCLWVAAAAALLAQDAAPLLPTKGFTIAVLQGDGVLNPLPRPPQTHVAIRVADPKGLPIKNAVAVFEFPEGGASSTFSDGGSVKVLLTNERGEATADLKSNEVPGKYRATITVNYLGQSSLVRLNQENAFPYRTPTAEGNRLLRKRGFRLSTKTLLIVAGVVVGAVVGVVAAHHGGASGSQTNNPPAGNGGITITPGTGTVGGH
jgi:hypothetical protein